MAEALNYGFRVRRRFTPVGHISSRGSQLPIHQQMQIQDHQTPLRSAFLCAFCALCLFAANSVVGGSLHAQAAAPQNQSTSAAYGITPEEQAGIDRDISRHFGSAPANPGPKAKLSGSMRPAAVRAVMRKVADWELEQSQPYFDRIWTSSALYDGFLAASPALQIGRAHV